MPRTDKRIIDDTMRQRLLLKLAMNRMRRKQQLARGAWIFAGLTGLLWTEPFPLTDGERYLISAGFALAALLMQIPFLRSPCPNCGKPYHGITNPYRNPNGAPPPCRRCGFDIDKHVTPY